MGDHGKQHQHAEEKHGGPQGPVGNEETQTGMKGGSSHTHKEEHHGGPQGPQGNEGEMEENK